ncbi:MAG: PadR family transcriptional regulator [Alphaproteobacteria bacterium]|nr:PadR family transcriptional regulator [Alphaproteobacteria bacterium]
MHFRFRFDRDGFHKEFGTGWSGRGARWAAFAQRFADEFGGDGSDGPPRPRRRFGAEALKVVILHLVKAEPRHGYELIKAIEALSAGFYTPSPGMIYPMLTLLAEQGLISELPGDDAKRRYAITPDGEAALAAAEAELKAALARLADLAGMASRRRHGAVRDAMADLKAAVRSQLADQDDNSERAARIAEIIATATRAVAALDA